METPCMENTDLLCRTCLCFMDDDDYYSIFKDMELLNTYMICTSLKADPLDEYPKSICGSCYDQLQLFSDFKQMCCDTLSRFKDFLKSSSAKFIEKESALIQEEILKQNRAINCKSIVQSEHTYEKDKNFFEDEKHKFESIESKTKEYNNSIEMEELKNSVKKHQENRIGIVNLSNKTKSIGYQDCTEKLNKINIYSHDIDKTSSDNITKNSIRVQTFQEPQTDTVNLAEPKESNKTPATKIEDNIKQEKTTCVTKKMLHFKSILDVDEKNNNSAYSLQKISKVMKEFESFNKYKEIKEQLVFSCSLCSKKFYKEERFQAHMRVHKGLKGYFCSQCDKQYSRIYSLQAHIKQQHSGSNRFTCTNEGCMRVYKQKKSLLNHASLCPYSNGVLQKNYVCEICGKTFSNKIFLNRHRFMHLDQSLLPFECDQCGKRFSKKLNLTYHLNRHAGIKNFICSHCGIRKTTKSELKSHMNYHTLEKKWTCGTCGKVFNSLGNLNFHMRTVHRGDRDYKCRYCHLRFGKRCTLKYHEMRHTGERPHQCSLCGRGFIQAVALRVHMKVHEKKIL